MMILLYSPRFGFLSSLQWLWPVESMFGSHSQASDILCRLLCHSMIPLRISYGQKWSLLQIFCVRRNFRREWMAERSSPTMWEKWCLLIITEIHSEGHKNIVLCNIGSRGKCLITSNKRRISRSLFFDFSSENVESDDTERWRSRADRGSTMYADSLFAQTICSHFRR